MIKRILMAAALAIGIILPSSSPAAAWNGHPEFSKGSTIYYCFNPNSGWTNTMKAQMRYGVDLIDNNANALTMTEVFSGPACTGDGRGQYLRFTIDSGRCAIMCYIQDFTHFGIRRNHEIAVNPYFSFLWTTDYVSCRQSPSNQCPPYAWQSMAHEIMHWIGFEHPGYPGNSLGSCNLNGYYTNQTSSACDTYGERLMYAYAADGFWRTLGAPSSDDFNGLNAWYDW